MLEGFASAERGPCITAEESIAEARATIARVAAVAPAARADLNTVAESIAQDSVMRAIRVVDCTAKQ